MSTDNTGAALAAVLDALTLVQGQLDAVSRGNARIEATQRDILARLDTIDAGQAAVTDLVPILETILARSIEDRELIGARLATVAGIAAFAHAAAAGRPAALPVNVADDPLLERFSLSQPADLGSSERALTTWRAAVREVPTGELNSLLASQYQPSATDTPASRVLRYRLAAITRAEIEGRGVAPVGAPASTVADDQSAAAREARSAHLARLWRAGESAALYAEPELASALDLFALGEQRQAGSTEKKLAAELAALHGLIGKTVEKGERPSLLDAEPLLGDRSSLMEDRAADRTQSEPDL